MEQITATTWGRGSTLTNRERQAEAAIAQVEAKANATASRKTSPKPAAPPVKPAAPVSKYGTPPRSIGIDDFAGLQAGEGCEQNGQRHLTPQQVNLHALKIFRLTEDEEKLLVGYTAEIRRLRKLLTAYNPQTVQKNFQQERNLLSTPGRRLTPEDLDKLSVDLSRRKLDAHEKAEVIHRTMQQIITESLGPCLAVLRRFQPILEREFEKVRVESRERCKRYGLTLRIPDEVEWALAAQVDRLTFAIESGLTHYGGLTPFELLRAYISEPEAAQ